MKKLMSLILALCLALTCASFAFADEDGRTASAQGFASQVNV